jgi:hypothetical protein
MIRTLTSATLAASALALAATAEETIVIDVSTVDFADSAQVAAVYETIVAASEAVCEDGVLRAPRSELGLGERAPLYAMCVADTVDRSIAAAGLAPLAQIHAMRDAQAFEVAAQ